MRTNCKYTSREGSFFFFFAKYCIKNFLGKIWEGYERELQIIILEATYDSHLDIIIRLKRR